MTKEPVSRRPNARARVEQLKADVKHLQGSIRNLGYRCSAREQEEREREQLLSMRFTTNAAANGSGQGGVSSSETSILIDRALEHNNALNVRTLDMVFKDVQFVFFEGLIFIALDQT